MDITFDNKLPHGLEKLLTWILSENRVQSWRFSGETSLTLSIRFNNIEPMSSPLQSTDQHGLDNNNTLTHMYSHSYRSKPPSSVLRDRQRSWAWKEQYGCDLDMAHSNVYTPHSTDSGYNELSCQSPFNNPNQNVLYETIKEDQVVHDI